MNFVDLIKEIEPKVMEICDSALKDSGILAAPHVNQIFSGFQALSQVKTAAIKPTSVE